jgi:hypothetical protein
LLELENLQHADFDTLFATPASIERPNAAKSTPPLVVPEVLSSSTANAAYEMTLFEMLAGYNPYPEGAERKRINDAFGNLLEMIETVEDDAGNVTLRSVLSLGGLTPGVGFPVQTIAAEQRLFADEIDQYLAGNFTDRRSLLEPLSGTPPKLVSKLRFLFGFMNCH